MQAATMAHKALPPLATCPVHGTSLLVGSTVTAISGSSGALATIRLERLGDSTTSGVTSRSQSSEGFAYRPSANFAAPCEISTLHSECSVKLFGQRFGNVTVQSGCSSNSAHTSVSEESITYTGTLLLSRAFLSSARSCFSSSISSLCL